MVDLRIRLDKIESKKLVQEETGDKEVTYKVDVSMNETDKRPGSVTLSFTLNVSSQPPIVAIMMSGSAMLVGTKGELLQLLTTEDPKSPPPILAKVYERLYGTLYLICDAMQVSHPLPTLLRD